MHYRRHKDKKSAAIDYGSGGFLLSVVKISYKVGIGLTRAQFIPHLRGVGDELQPGIRR